MATVYGRSRLDFYSSPFPPSYWTSNPSQPFKTKKRVIPAPLPSELSPEEPKIVPIEWNVSMQISSVVGCCGVRAGYSMADIPVLAQSHKRNKEISDVSKDLYWLSLEKVKEKYPDDYAKLRTKWEIYLNERCRSVREDRAINLIFHFVKYHGAEGWVTPILRELVSEFPGAVNMGEYLNPNSGNIINGWMIPTVPDKRLDLTNVKSGEA